jgi:CBS domain-containing protein
MTADRILQTKGGTVITIQPKATVGDALAVLADNNIGAIIVSIDGDSVDGIISERDIVRAMHKGGPAVFDALVEELMTKDVRTCARTDPARGMLTIMTDRRIRHLPVVDAGKLIGLISIGDAVKIRLDDLVAETEAMRDYITH